MTFRSKAAIAAALIITLALTLGAGTISAHEQRDVHDYTLVVGFLVEPAYEGLKNGVFISVRKQAAMQGMDHDEGAMSMDVNEHSAIFGSPALAPGQSFSFEVTHMLEGLTIPYHSHEDHDLTGSIMVSESAEMSGTVPIEIHDGMFMPADVIVRPGTTLVWTNHAIGPQTATSGLAPEAGHEHEAESTVPVEGLQDTLKVEVTHVATGKSTVLTLRPVFGAPGEYTADLIPTAPGVYEFRFFGTIEGEEINESFVSAGAGGGFDDILSSNALQFPETVRTAREIEAGVTGAQNTAQDAEDAAAEAKDDASSASTLALAGIVLGAIGTVAGVGSAVATMRRR